MSDHGYYWVYRFENDNPSVAYRSKQGRWQFMGPYDEWTKMVKKVGYTHPYEVLRKLDDYKEAAE